METPTVKVKSTDPKTQGPYVLVNQADYDADPSAYELYSEAPPAPPKPLTAAEKKAAEEAAKKAAKAEAEAKAKAEADAKAATEEAAKKAASGGWNT